MPHNVTNAIESEKLCTDWPP